MSYISGTGSKLQAGKQSTWGTAVTPDTLINMTSESINFTVTKESEGSLIGTKTEGDRDLTAIKIDGSVSTILKPEFAPFLFEQVLGIADASWTDESATGAVRQYKEFKLNEPGTDLPLSTFVLRRGGEQVTGGVASNWNVKKYSDVTITGLTINAPAQQYVTADFNIIGRKEETGTLSDGQTCPDFTKGSYKCTSAKLKYGQSYSSELDVENTTISIDNGVTEAPAVYTSGVYASRPVPGQRTVNVSFNLPYSQNVNTFRATYYSSEDPSNLQLELHFTNKEKVADVTPDKFYEEVVITLPKVALTNGNGNVGGTDLIDCSFEGVALTPAGGEPITIKVYKRKPTNE